MRASRTSVIAMTICAFVALSASAAKGAPSAPQSSELPATPRVLVISLPGVTWQDISESDLPNLRSVIDQSAVANLAVRVTQLKTPVGDGYAAVGAGARAVGPPPDAGQAFEPEEALEADDAARCTNVSTASRCRGAATQLSLEAINRANRRTGTAPRSPCSATRSRGPVCSAAWWRTPMRSRPYLISRTSTARPCSR